MKVLQIAYSGDIAGGERVLLDISAGLLKQGHSVHAAIPAMGELSGALDEMGIPWTICHLHKTYDLRGSLEIASIIRRESIDLVHSHGMLVNLLARTAALLARATAQLNGEKKCIPLVNTTHIARRLWNSQGSLVEDLKSIYYCLYDKFTAPLASRIVAVSNAVALDLHRQGVKGDNVCVIRNGIDLQKYGQGRRSNDLRQKCNASDDDFLIGMVGRLAPQKSLDVFLQAAALAAPLNKRLKFAVAGDGPLAESLMALRDRLGLQNRFEFLGALSNVDEFLASINLFTLTSSWEGLPLVVLEAMAAGRAVAATSADGTCEAVADGETGLLVKRGDAASMARTYLNLADDPKMVRAMEKAGKSRVEVNFSLQRVINDYISLYHELMPPSSDLTRTANPISAVGVAGSDLKSEIHEP
ncbi:MAG: hypothetical protein CVV64_10990 [Candidatus Wallbacteria bacterium HGW-Wallbacteria-1]|jgi:glycosyltransferase involved in cell wall biosynthesis|uniref:Glycosyltransferase family 1 protein n=1 Tax=Candidatus Wallbacteria bacterium HGW-Wallbacteria-1 TaxID=2013854 RepID=A0A2N1PPI9_9BACT|nr:MAG: hypothetical protein CVV64_10990 [Candidatus Wallbacteria bacterium HGW-Wallbacteria-1]